MKTLVCLLFVFIVAALSYVVYKNDYNFEKVYSRGMEYYTDLMPERHAVQIPTRVEAQEHTYEDNAVPLKTTTKLKQGYCFIGEDKGVRHCVAMSNGDKCMSNDVYERREICEHPKLRN